MTQVLQLAHFVKHHRVPNVDIGSRRVQTQFDAQRNARGFRAGQFFQPVLLWDQLLTAPQGHGQRFPNTVGYRKLGG